MVSSPINRFRFIRTGLQLVSICATVDFSSINLADGGELFHCEQNHQGLNDSRKPPKSLKY